MLFCISVHYMYVLLSVQRGKEGDGEGREVEQEEPDEKVDK